MDYTKFIVALLVVGLIGCATDADVLGPVEADAGESPADARLAGSDAAPQQLGCEEGAPCFNIAKCILHGICKSGECTSNVVPCFDGNVCTDDVCDSNSGCVNLSNEATCTDNDECSGGDVCSSGACQTNSNLICDDNNPCTQDVCHAYKGCENSPVSGGCDDGNVCTLDTCSSKTAGCVYEVINGAVLCDDSNPCTIIDYCLGGTCIAATVKDCNDVNPCTKDSCALLTGCVHVAIGSLCSDGDPCTKDDFCVAGVCDPGGQLVCNDFNSCTTDSCMPDVGCQFSLDLNEPCNDGNKCTLNDSCKTGGSCAGSDMLVCDDGNSCTNDLCYAGPGCQHFYPTNGKLCARLSRP